MIIEIEIAIFKENQMESISRFFWASVTRFRYRITPEGPAIGAGGHRMGFIYTPCDSSHAECGGVYIFNSKYWAKKTNCHRTLYLKNQNQIEMKTTIVTSRVKNTKKIIFWWFTLILQHSASLCHCEEILWYWHACCPEP